MSLRIHVICLALNEEIFIEEFLKALYPFVQGISVITQYDRDYYGNELKPDSTVAKILKYPDKEGKIHLVVRRFKDETAARNHEINALNYNPAKTIIPHGVDLDQIYKFHEIPDYYLIADADEIYDVETFPRILNYLEEKKPRGMRITGYNYYWTWNQRVPTSYEHFVQYGFIKPKLKFKKRRRISFNQSRLQKFLKFLNLPDVSGQLFGTIDCPEKVGVFHHGSYLGDEERHRIKLSKHSHKYELDTEKFINDLKKVPTEFIATAELPYNITNGNWPSTFFKEHN